MTSPISTLAAGGHVITAAYLGDDNCQSSESAALELAVAKATLVVTVDNKCGCTVTRTRS